MADYANAHIFMYLSRQALALKREIDRQRLQIAQLTARESGYQEGWDQRAKTIAELREIITRLEKQLADLKANSNPMLAWEQAGNR